MDPGESYSALELVNAGPFENVNCDLCLSRPATYFVKQDLTRLCEVCLSKYLHEHQAQRYEVVVF